MYAGRQELGWTGGWGGRYIRGRWRRGGAQVYDGYVHARAAGAGCVHVRLTRSICYRSSSLPPPFLTGGGSFVPGRDGGESVALPLQSYRSTAAGVSSRCPPSLLSFPHSLLVPPPPPPLSSPLCPPSYWKVSCCHLLASKLNSASTVVVHVTLASVKV